MKDTTAILWIAALASVLLADATVSQRRRVISTTAIPDIEPPRPEDLRFLGLGLESRTHHTLPSHSTAKRAEGKTYRTSTSEPIGGKSRYFTKAKALLETDSKTVPVEQATQPKISEQKVSQSAPVDDNIKCVKIDKQKTTTMEDSFKEDFKRDDMVCYKCEDLKHGGTYENCSYSMDPKNKAYFESHQKSYNSKDKPKFGEYHDKYDPSPSAEYLLAAASIGKYNYNNPSLSSSEHRDKYESPESSYTKSFSFSDDEDKHTPKSTNFEINSNKKEPLQSFSHHRNNTYHKQKEDDSPHGKDLYIPKSTKYSFSTIKTEPTLTYSYETTDKPISYSYKTEKAPDAAFKNEKKSADAGESKEYSYSKQSEKSKPTHNYGNTKVEPIRSYSYETTQKPIVYTYGTGSSSDSNSKANKSQLGGIYSPSEYIYRKTRNDPLKQYYESYSYGDDKPKKENRSEYSSYESEPQKQTSPQVKEYFSSSIQEVPKIKTSSSYIAEPSEELKRALGEFHKKDRSNCEQIKKDVMTCWICKDASGAQQEECMYLANTEPKVHRAAYSDVKEVTQPKGEASEVRKPSRAQQTTRRTSAPVVEAIHSDRPAPHPHHLGNKRPAMQRLQSAAPISPYREKSRREAQLAQAALKAQDDDDFEKQRNDGSKSTKPTHPKQHEEKLDDGGDSSDGAFTEETRDVFDKKFGFSLPAYMVERSTHEQLFDEAVREGR